ncbi:MAG: sensor domain-containing diguanylate cyclase [Armatimonadota bacterium]|nr:sensor domain-containing diguanylate cyclase [Armatimonadota bacterium]MDW8156120.1 sensor domain-containing diguanylate cyclase [Armatimonadota bacterium]
MQGLSLAQEPLAQLQRESWLAGLSLRHELAWRGSRLSQHSLLEAARRILRPMDLQGVLEEALTVVHTVFGYRVSAVLLVDRESRELWCAAHRGWTPEAARRRYRVGREGLAAWVAYTGWPYYAPDVQRDPRYVEIAPGVRSELALPLRPEVSETVGVLSVASTEPEAFSEDSRGLLEAYALLLATAVQRAARDEELSRLALTDPLTGLANHRALYQTLRRELAQASRYAFPLSVVLLDLDGFKQVNDLFGHPYGDEVLRQVARMATEACRGMDLPARLGGEEFVLVLPHAPKLAALQVAERLRRRIEETSLEEGLRLSASFGVAVFPDDGNTPDALIRAADEAMYRAKRAGGNRVEAS